jgi:hypothetical protein
MTGPTCLKRSISESRRRAAKSYNTEIPRCLAARCLEERVADKIFSLAGGERRVFGLPLLLPFPYAETSTIF